MLVLDGVEMLDVREAAQLADRTPETVRRWIWSGRLDARRHGNRLLVTRRDVEALIGGGPADEAMGLAQWAELVADQRRAGSLGTTSAETASASDLVLEDRRLRQGG